VLAAVAASIFLTVLALTIATRDTVPSEDGTLFVAALVMGGLGTVIAYRLPGNPTGWLMLGVMALSLTQIVAQLYSVLDYRQHGGRLPLGTAAVYWDDAYSLLTLLTGIPVILLFPDGRLTRRWKRLLWCYAAVAVVFVATQLVGSLPVFGAHRPAVDLRGNTDSPNSEIFGLGWLAAPFFLGCWIAFVAHPVIRWRRASGDERTQLKWLACGGAVSFAGLMAIVLYGNGSSASSRVVAALGVVAVTALPVSIGVAILKYRLYDIDRLISRTISYTILTVLLGAVFTGAIALATQVLPFSSPVSVAASTLLAAGLFSPLRRRVQRRVDRRFNRARYNADATVTAFSARLRDALDPDAIGLELLSTVDTAVAPAHVSIWIRPTS
jgi:hypothetical protein